MADFYKNFDYLRYGGRTQPSPGENALANEGQVLSITRLATATKRDESVYFKAFITTFNETFVSDWETEEIYGRADAVPMFRSTRRRFTLGFKVPAMSTGEAYENLGKVQKLLQFLYPSYSPRGSGTSQVITRSPLVRIKFMNLIRNVANSKRVSSTSATKMLADYNMAGEGLLGAITNVQVSHQLENADAGVIEKGTSAGLKALLPKLIEITLDFEPVHEHPLGWNTDGVFGKGGTAGKNNKVGTITGELFPYGVSLTTTDAPDESEAATIGEQHFGPEYQTTEAPSPGDSLEAEGEGLPAGVERAHAEGAAPDTASIDSQAAGDSDTVSSATGGMAAIDPGVSIADSINPARAGAIKDIRTHSTEQRDERVSTFRTWGRRNKR